MKAIKVTFMKPDADILSAPGAPHVIFTCEIHPGECFYSAKNIACSIIDGAVRYNGERTLFDVIAGQKHCACPCAKLIAVNMTDELREFC